MNRKYDPDQLKSALDGVRSGEVSIQEAAKRYGIVRTTLERHLNGNFVKRLDLTATEELRLVETIKSWIQYDNSITKHKITEAAKQILKSRKDLSQDKSILAVSKLWLKDFMFRNKKICYRVLKQTGSIESLSTQASSASTQVIEKVIEEFESYEENPEDEEGSDSAGKKRYVYVEVIDGNDSDDGLPNIPQTSLDDEGFMYCRGCKKMGNSSELMSLHKSEGWKKEIFEIIGGFSVENNIHDDLICSECVDILAYIQDYRFQVQKLDVEFFEPQKRRNDVMSEEAIEIKTEIEEDLKKFEDEDEAMTIPEIPIPDVAAPPTINQQTITISQQKDVVTPHLKIQEEKLTTELHNSAMNSSKKRNIQFRDGPRFQSYCVFCGQIFNNKSEFVNHVESAHENRDVYFAKIPEPAPNIMCLKCQKMFCSKESLVAHMRNCEEIVNGNIKTHENQVENSLIPAAEEPKATPQSTLESKPKMNCPKCQKPYSSNKSFAKHLILCGQILDINIKPEEDQAEDLLIPVAAEPESKPKPRFQCPKCQKLFTSKGRLVNHKRRFHPFIKKPKKLFMFPCSFCPKILSTFPGLTEHIERKHKTEAPPVNKRQENKKMKNLKKLWKQIENERYKMKSQKKSK